MRLFLLGPAVRLDIGVARAVALGVEHQGGPALRLGGIAGLVEHLGVEPADNRAAAARSQSVALVKAEMQIVRVEAGVDKGVLHRLLAASWQRLSFSGKSLPELWSERSAEGGIVEAAHRGGQPHPTLWE
jgi:hypothetical protein